MNNMEQKYTNESSPNGKNEKLVLEVEEDIVKAFDGCPSETEFQGRANVCDGCPGKLYCQNQAQNGNKTDPDQEQIDLRMSAIKHKILVVSGKGGVGKSSTAAQLAIAMSERGKKVGLLDVDICGPSIPRLLGVEDKEIITETYGWIPIKPDNHDLVVMSVGLMLKQNASPIVWRGPKKTNMIKRFLKDTFWSRLDYLIIDTPPGTSDEHLTVISALRKANPDGVVIVTTPQEVALSTIRKEINFCKKMKFPILGIIENMSGFVCPCCGEKTDIFMSGGGEQLAHEYGINFLGRIPLDPNVALCLDSGKCVFCNHKVSPAVQAMVAIVDKLMNSLE